MEVARVLVRFAMRRYSQALPPEISGPAKLSIYDSLGCMIAGSRDEGFQKLRNYLEEYGGNPVCSVIAEDGLKTDPEHAASMNAMAAHIRDYDDMCAVLYGHATSGLFSATLALSETLHRSGEEMLQAFVAGVDVAAMMGRGLVANGYPHACDSSSTLTIFGVAAAAGLLMGLTEEQLVNAFGIAASEAAGLRANYGTMAKDLTAARTAARGIYAANMAALGFDANPAIIEDENGFLAACASELDYPALRQALNDGVSIFEDTGMRVKNYPTCGGTHCAMDAVISLKNRGNIEFDDVDRVECIVQTTAKSSDKYPIPANPNQGKFSIAYCVAVALLYGYGKLEAFCGKDFPDSRLLELTKRTSVRLDDSIFPDAFDGAQVTLILKNGERVTEKVDYCTGSRGKELTVAQRIEKFGRCVENIMMPEAAKECFAMIQQMEEYEDVAVFVKNIVDKMRK